MSQTDIPGYTYGTDAVPRSPVNLQELELLEATVLLGDDDLAALRRSGEVLASQVEAMHQAWVKAVLLQVILWSYPYVRDGDF